MNFQQFTGRTMKKFISVSLFSSILYTFNSIKITETKVKAFNHSEIDRSVDHFRMWQNDTAFVSKI